MRVAPAALVALATFVVSGNGTCEGGMCVLDKDENLLLQRQLRSSVSGPGDNKPPKKRHIENSGKVSLALAGGGFLAHSCLSGVFASLLKYADVQALFQNVAAISTASAGGWFIGQLVYSPHFLNLVQTMSQNNTQAGELYGARWILKFMSALGLDTSKSKVDLWDHESTKFMSDSSILNVDLDFLEVLLEFWWASNNGQNRSWVQFIDVVMGSTSGGDITAVTTFGSPVNAWAEGKLLQVGTSIITPGDSGPGSCNDPHRSPGLCVGPRQPSVTVFGNGSTVTSYSSGAAGIAVEPVAVFNPARFTVELGSGPDQPPPRTFCQSCGDLSVTYTSSTSTNSKNTDTAPVHAFSYNSNTPMVAAVAAGSAFLGELAVLPFFDYQYLKMVADEIGGLVDKIPWLGQYFRGWFQSRLFDALITQFPVWSMTAANPSANFQEGHDFVDELVATGGRVSPQAFEGIVKRQFLGFADAGLSDNSAIGHAIASGLNDIVAVGYPNLPALERMVAGVPSDRQILNLPGLNFCPFCFATFQVFQEDLSTLQAMYPEKLKFFNLTQTTQLKSLQVGTLTLTTVANQYFGIEAGRSINLHIINMNCRPGIGGIGYQTYPALVQEIVDAFLDAANAHLLQEVLSWLL